MPVTRNYTGKDAEMLISISSITQAAIANKAVIIAKRSSWADPYFADHEADINAAISTYLGVDSALTLRTQTTALRVLMNPAKVNLTDVKIQIEQDFKSDKPRMAELLNTLGYKTHWSGTSRSDQESLIQLLYQFKTNLTPAIRTELETKGIDGPTLTAITSAADGLMAANISQETIKQSRKAVTEAAVTVFNNLYDKTISISTISKRFFKDSPAIMDQFSYSKILKNLRGGGLTTRFDGDVVVSPDTPYILDSPKITNSSVITLLTTSNLVYACRNAEGCVSSGIDSYHINPDVENTIRKVDLVGFGNQLVLTNLTPGFATVHVKVQD
jgi:hypothetical protein